MWKINIIIVTCFLTACSSGESDSSSPENAVVYDGREILRCTASNDILTDSAQILINDGIDVLSSSCGVTIEEPTPNGCSPTIPRLLIHEVRIENIIDVELAGFININNLAGTNGQSGYELIECDNT